MGPLLTAMGMQPVKFTSESEFQKSVTTESKMFSIYAVGVVKGYKRETRLSIHEVVDFRAAPGLVLDLRGNIGGIGLLAMGIGGWLVGDRNRELGTMTTREGSLRFVLNPRTPVFDRPVAVLVDEVSISTAEILAGGLQDLGRARVFGSRSAGAALPSAIERLPNGDGFQYAFANYVRTGGQPLEGRGVLPDVEAPLTREALLAGRDPALEAALTWIRERAGP